MEWTLESWRGACRRLTEHGPTRLAPEDDLETQTGVAKQAGDLSLLYACALRIATFQLLTVAEEELEMFFPWP